MTRLLRMRGPVIFPGNKKRIKNDKNKGKLDSFGCFLVAYSDCFIE